MKFRSIRPLSLFFAGVALGMVAGPLAIAAEEPVKEVKNAPQELPAGAVIVDDSAAEITGDWKHSTHVAPYVNNGYLHDENQGKGEKSVRFPVELPTAGNYIVSLAYTGGTTRAASVPVQIETADGVKSLLIDQRSEPTEKPFLKLGVFKFNAGKGAAVVISNRETSGYVIADAVRFVPTSDAVTELPAEPKVLNPAPNSREKIAAKPIKPLPNKPQPSKAVVKVDEKATPPMAADPANFDAAKLFAAKPTKEFKKLTSAELDALVETELTGAATAPLVGDEQFLRRATLDVIGRQPTADELMEFLEDKTTDKRAKAIDRLLALEEYGRNWGNYWTDTISHRVQGPELTFMKYEPLKQWFADQFNSGKPWNDIVRQLLTAKGVVKENPAAAFIGYHQGNAINLAAETSRVFLGIQIQCAQCHDHKFDHWKMEEFHQLAAFFVRVKVSMPQQDSTGAAVAENEKASEYKMPGGKGFMEPTLLTGEALGTGLTDEQRRQALAAWVAGPHNPWFAKSYTNRIWSRLMGHGFYEPVDNIGETQVQLLPTVHESLADSFVASAYDTKEFLRLVMNSGTYQRELPQSDEMRKQYLAASRTTKSRGDEVFDSLVAAVGLPNVTPPQAKATGTNRFPPPPKSTRDLVNDAFQFDPSLGPDEVSRTVTQAMWLMNNAQLQAQVNASDETTRLAKLLAETQDDKQVVEKLFQNVLARRPTDKEVQLAVDHVATVGNRAQAFEDMPWSLLNSAEFTTKR